MSICVYAYIIADGTLMIVFTATKSFLQIDLPKCMYMCYAVQSRIYSTSDIMPSMNVCESRLGTSSLLRHKEYTYADQVSFAYEDNTSQV